MSDTGPAIRILVGTMTGNAERVAEEIELAFDDRARIETHDMDRLTPAIFHDDAIFLICSSTYGQGDVPDNARDFYKVLVDTRPDLRGVRYGVISLGDMTYAYLGRDAGDASLVVRLDGRSAASVGDAVHLHWPPAACHAFDASGHALRRLAP